MKSVLRLSLLVLWTALCNAENNAEPIVATPVTAWDPRAVTTEKPKINVLEVLSGMGKAIQLLINQNKQIQSERQSDANLPVDSAEQKAKYREQAEVLRVEIGRRAGKLQEVVLAAIEVLKDRGDVVVRRILENLNTRLDQAKTRADKILKEPATSEMAIKTLNTINQGLNNVNSLIQHVLGRVNISINVDLKDKKDQTPAPLPPTPPKPPQQQV